MPQHRWNIDYSHLFNIRHAENPACDDNATSQASARTHSETFDQGLRNRHILCQ